MRVVGQADWWWSLRWRAALWCRRAVGIIGGRQWLPPISRPKWRLKRKQWAALGTSLVGAICLVSLIAFYVPTKAASYTFSSKDLLNGLADFNGINTANDGTMTLQQGDVGQWHGYDGVQQVQGYVRGDSDAVFGPNNVMYFMTYAANCRFSKYEVDFGRWSALADPPVSCAAGASLATDSQRYIYFLPGGGSTKFARYDIVNDSWTQLAAIPMNVSTGAHMTYVPAGSGAVYAFRGNTSNLFWRYDVGTNSWAQKAPFPATNNVNYGLDLTWDGSGSIYAISNNYHEFKRYTIATDQWSTLTSPVAPGSRKDRLLSIEGNIFDVQLNWCCSTSGGEQFYLRKYVVATNSWTDLATPPAGQVYDYEPTAVYDGSDNIYLLAGADVHATFYRYTISADSWNNEYSLNGNLDATMYHWQTFYDGAQSVYYMGGTWYGNLDHLYKLDLQTKQTTQLAYYPQTGPRTGIAGTYYNNALYMVPYFGNTTFDKYDLATNTWVQLPDFPFTSDWGTQIVDGGNGYMYVTAGGSRNQFYRYSEASGWATMASMPQSPYAGGGVARIGSSIYVGVGNSSAYLLRYDINTNTWTTLTTYTPVGKLDHGGLLVGDGSRYLYVIPGTRTDPENRWLYRYDTTSNTWKRLANLPADTNVGPFGFWDNNTQRLYVAPAVDYTYLWYWTPTTGSYVTSGTWYSAVKDLTQAQSWSSLQATLTGSGTATLYTRTSDNGKIWDAWQLVNGTSIASQPRRYIQVKVVLSGDGTATPTLSGLSLNYSQESVPPSLPSQFSAQGSQSGPALTTGQTYEYEHPYFSWQGADDGTNGSGVDGYYVYYGLDSNANPVTDGNYQQGNTYVVTTAMTAGSVYYVRLAVKDRLGNISAPATYFSYRYFYISPPGTAMMTSQADFAAGTNTSVDLTTVDGSMRLKAAANGAWATGPMNMMPDTSSGGAMEVVGDYIYVLRGASSTTFWRYNVVNQTWETLSAAPGIINTGSALVWDKGNYLYALAGNGSTNFYQYNLTTAQWSTLGTLPVAARSGTDLAYVGQNRLALLFTSSTDFYVYDINSGQFNNKASMPESVDSYRAGAGLWYDGNDSVYAYLGGYASQDYIYRNNMAVYSLSQDSWKTLSTPPSNGYFMENNLVGDGQGHLYMFTSDQWYDGHDRAMGLKYDIASDSWSDIPSDDVVPTRGTLASDEQRYLYIIPSTGNSRKIVRYDTVTNQWSPLGDQPTSWQRVTWDEQDSWGWSEGYATTAAYDGSDTVYALGADEGNFSRMIAFSVSANKTTYMPPPPYAGIGGSLAYSAGKLYYLPGWSRQDFFRFNFGTQAWEAMAQYPASVYRPASNNLVVDSSGNLYALRGQNGTQFYKYTPNSSTGTWSSLASIPGAIYSGSVTYDGGDYIYVLRSNGTQTFYRYSISGNSWSTMANFPVSISYGATLVYQNGKLYAGSGNFRSSSYIYDVASNTWTQGADAPEPYRYGSTVIRLDSQRALYLPGQYGSPDIWQFNFPSSSTAYQGLAVHISQPIQVDGLFDYAGLNAEVDQPAGTMVEFYTRTSADSTTWSDWALVDQVKHYSGQMSAHVVSTPQKYIQIKVVMTSLDNLSTPTVGSYSLDYYFDVDPPNNPTLATVYADSTKATTLSTNTWYKYDHPLIDWPDPGDAGGATDGLLGSHIKGYWVYVGTDQTALPQTAGTFTANSDYTPALTSAGTYYVRIQAEDETGNVATDVFAPFIYKFDNVPPANPAFISVTPSGFTSKNDFSFQWPNSSDADSGVASYCYHTGATDGAFATETCQSGLTLNDISAAYRSGTNVFYLRTQDQAGNFATSYAQVSFYYSTDAPGPVQNLRAIPPVSPQNLFAFTWDLPATFAGDPNRLNYCYSINELPSALNTTCTTDKYLPPFKAATRQGTNIIYMVAKDEANNVNWNNYALSNFIANTVSPGIPLNLVGTDSSDRLSNRWSLTLTWSQPTFVGNGIDHYIVERSTDNHTFDSIGTVSTTAFVDMTVAPGTLYYYRVRASDNIDNEGGPSGVVSLQALGKFISPPKIVSSPVAHSSFDQADISWVTERPSTSFVYYGTKPSDLQQSKGSLDEVSDHLVTITGLSPSTTYYFKVQSFDSDRNYSLDDAFSQIYSLQTTETARINSVSSSDITLSTAFLSWSTSVPTKTKIEYGQTIDYGLYKDDDGGLTTNHLIKLDGLLSGTTYHYRINATTEYGSTVQSDDYTLTTVPYPRISNVRFQPLQDAATISVAVTWDTNVATDSDVVYDSLGSSKEQAQTDMVTSHKIVLSDLAASADYTFTLRGRDSYGNMASSDVQKWRSQVDTRPPVISDVSVDVSSMGIFGSNKAQLIVSWHTDEPASTQLTYSNPLKDKKEVTTPLDTEPTTSHVVVISNLDMASIYKIKPESRDISGNLAYGQETTTVTPDSQNSVLDVLLQMFQHLIGQ